MGDAVVAAHFPSHAAVAAADNEHPFRMGMQHEGHVGNHFMVGPFILH